ncbi:MAG: response regulator, partial [Oligoflexia bacterium]|nr:response regulator [Oligoflexia bacterium]
TQGKYPDLKSMVHSNRYYDKDRKTAKNLGAKIFAPKPLNIEHLVLFLDDKEAGFTEIERITKPGVNAQKTILVANDEEIVRSYFEITLSPLKKDGYEVQTFKSGEDLLNRLKELKSCLMIFTDEDMGDGMFGTDLLKEITSLNIPCRKFMVSGMPGDAFIGKAKSLGAEAVFTPTSVTLELVKGLLSSL